MRTSKVMTVLVACAMACGCNNLYKNVGSQEEIDDLRKELSDEKQSHKDLQDKYIEQNQELSEILEQLSTITGKTADLRLDLEHGSAQLTQAEQISHNIQSVKSRIAALEKTLKAASGNNKEMESMIDNFKNVIQQQEDQITAMTEEINQKNKTIREQKDTIDTQSQTILQQKEALALKVAEQAKMLNEAGEELESIGDNAPSVSWKKNKEKMGAMQQSLYKSALNYYKKAYEAGYEPAKANISKVQAKIAAE